MTQHVQARGMHFIVFTRALHCVNLAPFIHAQRTVIYGVVIVSRNLERTNRNDGFKMTALEYMVMDGLLAGGIGHIEIT